MKSLSFLVLFVCFLQQSFATNYYFSSVSGDDSRTSTQAQSSSTPWKTLNKLNAFFTSLKPGDHILFKRGETFYGSITVKKSGTSSSPIVFGAYGTGNKPIITSLIKLGNWVSKSNGIWESYNSALSSSLNMVLLNGAEQEMGRYPNSNASNGGYLVYESHVGKTSITDKQLTSAINWTGAQLVLRPRRWILHRNLIKSHSGSTISYTTSSIYEPFDNYGYFIQNSIKTLDRLGEWYYNPSTKKLSVYFGSSSPSSYTVQASTTANLVSTGGYSYIVFDNLAVKGSNNYGISIKSGSNVSVTNCNISFSGEDGIVSASHTNLKIENCTVSNSNNNGVNLESGVNNSTVKNTKISNTSVLPGMTQGGDGNGNGLLAYGSGNIIEYNEIKNTGYMGITFNGNDLTIKNNLIDSFCTIKDDGAGIYTNGTSTTYKNRKVTGNIVLNGIGNSYGTDNPSKLSAIGIYVDNEASPVTITDNTTANCNRTGVYIHNCAGMTVKSNTVYNNDIQMTFIQESDHPSSVRNNVVNSNILFSKNSAQLVSSIRSNTNDISNFGKFDSNYYSRPIDDRVTIYNYYPGSTINLDLAGWKSKYGDDPASKITAKQIAAYKLNKLLSSNKFSNGSLTSAITGVSASSCSISLNLSGLLDGGCLQVSPSSTKSNVYVNIGGVTAGKKYVVRYSVKGTVNNNMVLNTFLRQGSSPYSVLTASQGRKVSTSRSNNEMVFLAPSTQSSVHVVFQTDQQSKYYLDNIQVYEADATITNPNDSIKFVYNATTASKSVTLSGSYVDAKGKKFSNSITLAPYASAVLIKSGSTTSASESLTPPKVSMTTPTNTTYSAPARIKVNAVASDADGTITKVEFYKGSTLIHTEHESPYDCILDNASAGSYTITAKATDNDGLTATSSSIVITVKTATLARSATSSADATLNPMSEITAITSVDTIASHPTITANASALTNVSTDALNQPNLLKESLSLKVGPNPTTNDLFIYANGFPTDKRPVITIYSISGILVKVIQPGTLNQVVQLNVSSLSRGAYVVKVVCGNSVLSKQFIKQ